MGKLDFNTLMIRCYIRKNEAEEGDAMEFKSRTGKLSMPSYRIREFVLNERRTITLNNTLNTQIASVMGNEL